MPCYSLLIDHVACDFSEPFAPIKGPWVFNSLWPGDDKLRYRSGLTLAQVMACCLTAPSQPLPEPMLTDHHQ